MLGYFEGYSDNNIKYCPFCGEIISTKIADGSVRCEKCCKEFAIIEI